MAANIYPGALTGLLSGSLSWTADEIKAVFVNLSFAYDSTKAYIGDIAPSFIIEESAPIQDRTFTNLVGNGDPAAFLQLFDTQILAGVLLYQDVGDPAYSPLLFHWDSDSVDGLPRNSFGLDLFVFPVTPPGGYFDLGSESSVIVGPLNTYGLSTNFALNEITGGVAITLPNLIVSGRLTVTTQAVCANPPADKECAVIPTIRSSKCE